MSLPNLLYLYRRRLRARLVQELLALVGIAVGVALLFAVLVSSTSLTASIAQLTEGLVGDADLVVASRAPQGFDAAVADELARVEGVERVAPALSFRARLVGEDDTSATVLSADQELVAMGGSLLALYDSPRMLAQRAVALTEEVADATGAHVGGEIVVETNGRRVRAPVGAILEGDDVGTLARSPVAVVPLFYAAELSGVGDRATHVYLDVGDADPAGVAERVAEALPPGLAVHPADHDNRLFEQLSEPTSRSATLFATISALVGFLFAFNAMLLMSRERRAVVTELRLSGYRTGAVVQVVLFDALVLGVAGSALGLAVGELLSRHLFAPEPGFLAYAFPVGTARTVTTTTIVIAALSGVACAVLATATALAEVRSPGAGLDAPDDRLQQRQAAPRAERARVAFGLVCVAAATATLLAAPDMALLGMGTLVLALLVALPTALRGTLSLANALRTRLPGVVPLLALGELRSAGTRSVAITTIVAIAVFGSTAIEGARTDLVRGLDTAAHGLNAGTGIWVTPGGEANELSTEPFPGRVARRLERTPGVTAVRPYGGGFLDLGDRRVWVIAPDARNATLVPATEILEGDPDEAARRLREGGWVTLSDALADELGVGVGDAFTLDAPRPTPVRVAAITTNLGWSGGAIVLNRDDQRAAWGADAVAALQVHVAGARPEEARALVKRALGPDAWLQVQTAAEREEVFRDGARAGLSRLTQIAALMLIAAALAMAAAMAGMVWQRRTGLADLKLVGITEQRLWRVLLTESAVLLGVGSLVGAAFGLYGQQLLDRALSTVTGFPVEASLGWGVAGMSVAVVVCVALAIAAIPGWLAARVPADVAFQE